MVHTDLDQAFYEANIILLLDDFSSDLGHHSNEDRKRRVKNLSERYREYGRLIDGQDNKQVKVIVSGESFVNLRCFRLVENAPSISSHQFVATATQLEDEARAVVAEKMGVRPSGICSHFFCVLKERVILI